MDGAPSTLDLYDYKPDLIKLAGQEPPASFMKGIKTSTQGGVGKLFVSSEPYLEAVRTERRLVLRSAAQSGAARR
jgi:hypothetical protein